MTKRSFSVLYCRHFWKEYCNSSAKKLLQIPTNELLRSEGCPIAHTKLSQFLFSQIAFPDALYNILLRVIEKVTELFICVLGFRDHHEDVDSR